jgi:hypothetical protein
MKLKAIQEKISTITTSRTPVVCTYRVDDESVNAELRLRAEWTILVPVDSINYPKDLSGENHDLWQQMRDLSWEIRKAAALVDRRVPEGYRPHTITINVRTVSGPARRSEARIAWQIEQGKAFLADYRKATGKANLARVRKQIAALQAQQKALLPKLRESNSLYLRMRTNEREALKARNAEALKTGRFWEADHETLKGYFHPPFDKNYVADVSDKWRACLILECESVSYRAGYNNEWRHKLVGTGTGYLCGIDDNGDEWGHTVHDIPQSRDAHDNFALDSTVEDAMSVLFDIPVKALAECVRQGDLLFRAVTIPTADRTICRWCRRPEESHDPYCQVYTPTTIKAPVLTPKSGWEPRPSHVITSPSLTHNGVYFRAVDPITITHTSHATVTLPAGEYRLYMSRAAIDAD